jgi:hypothetical protein
VAPFIGVHIQGEILPAGGFDTLAESRWEDQIRPHRTVDDINNTTINERTWGRGLERPGDGVVALFLEGDFCQFFWRGGGRIEVAICNRAGKLDRTNRCQSSKIPQNSVHGGGGWNARGMAWRHCF